MAGERCTSRAARRSRLPAGSDRHAAIRGLIAGLQRQQTLNFWLTNRIPRTLISRLFGRFSRIRSPWLARWSIRVWQLFADDLRLDEARTQRFSSLQECFTRELAPGARPVTRDARILTSPCDAVVGAGGRIEAGTLLQAKGMVYPVGELVRDSDLASALEGGAYVTLRLKSSMYHRFHAPCNGRITRLDYVGGDAYNVNPPALARIDRLFCRNERAVIRIRPDAPARLGPVTLVAVAAVLVSSMRFSFLGDGAGGPRRAPGRVDCDVAVDQGRELGWFEHGSTIIVLAGPDPELGLAPGLAEGRTVRMGEPLLVPVARS